MVVRGCECFCRSVAFTAYFLYNSLADFLYADGIVVESMYWWDYSKLEKALQALVGHGNAV